MSYNEVMAKGDLYTVTIDDFSKGLNLQDPVEELDGGFIGPDSMNFIPVGQGKSLKPTDDIFPTSLATSTTRRPVELTPYSGGLFVANNDGSVDKLPGLTSYAATDSAGIPELVVSQDSALTFYYAYILRPPGSAATSVKVNISTNASVTWPGSPPQGTCAISWKTRMVIGGGSRIRYSTEGNPDSWPANNFVDIKTLDDDRDSIVGFEIIGEDLLVFKTNSTWLVFDPVSFDNRRLFSVGLLNRRCVARGSDRVFWMSKGGIYSTDGSELVEETLKVQVLFTENSPIALGGSIFYLGAGTFACLTVTRQDIIVASDGGGGMLLGYTKNKGPFDTTPWYPLRGNVPHALGLTYAAYDTGTGLSNNSPVVIGSAWEGSNVNELSYILGLGTALGPIIRNGVGLPKNPVLHLPTLHGGSQEINSRLRRMNLYGHGTLSDGSNESVEVFKNGATSTSFESDVRTFSGEFVRVRPEVRGRNFKVRIRGFGNCEGLSIHTVEAQLRNAGR